jgi:penicillin-binding protein 1C
MTGRARASAALTGLTLASMLFLFTVEAAIRWTPVPSLGRFETDARLLLDAQDRPLWAFLSPDERWRWTTEASDLSPQHLAMLIAYEDRRFWHHRGVDPGALARAAWQAVRHGKVVSGGSTLTMQTVRLLQPAPRTLGTSSARSSPH